LSQPQVAALVLTPDFNQLEVNPDLRRTTLQRRSTMFAEKLKIREKNILALTSFENFYNN
jgi:hypothetical protein